MKTPWQMAEVGSEFANQTALFAWAAMAANFGLQAAADKDCYLIAGEARRRFGLCGDKLPELQWLHAIKNAGHGDAIRGARAAAEGVRAGVPDIFLPVPMGVNVIWHGLYIELKRPDGKGPQGKLSIKQSEWLFYLRNVGYMADVCYGWEAARDAILKYLGR